MIVGQAAALTPESPRSGEVAAPSPGFQAELARAHAAPVSVPAQRTELTAAEASATLSQAWTDRFGEAPSPRTLAILTAQWSHETGEGRSMFNYNFAGIKGVGPSGLHVVQRTREGFGAQETVIRDSFRAYESALEGASDYLSLLDRKYPGALAAAKEGDVHDFVGELHDGGYFTGDSRAYARNVARRAETLTSVSEGTFEPLRELPRLGRPAPRAEAEDVLARSAAPSRADGTPHVVAAPSRSAAPPNSLHLETFTDHLALAALRIAQATDPTRA
jgi:hypothetical protein